MTITSSGQQVETFEAEDASHSDASTMALDSEAITLIESLGLKGQTKLVNAGTVTRLPYRAMEEREAKVYRVLCDATAKVEDFSSEAIPLRVLQVIAHARETGLFDELRVWYPKTYEVKDPVLVGIKKESLYPDDPKYVHLTKEVFFILARWGKTLLPLEQLEAMAVDLTRKTRLTKLTALQSQLRAALETTKESLDLAYLAKDVSVYGVAD